MASGENSEIRCRITRQNSFSSRYQRNRRRTSEDAPCEPCEGQQTWGDLSGDCKLTSYDVLVMSQVSTRAYALTGGRS